MNESLLKHVEGIDVEKVRRAEYTLLAMTESMNLSMLEELFLLNSVTNTVLETITLFYEVKKKPEDAVKSTMDDVLGELKQALGLDGEKQGEGEARE